jgi:hypothetical protein
MYAIKLGKSNNRFINWIDEKWYETTDVETHKFQEDELSQIKQWLVKHFQYKATFISDKGVIINWNHFDDLKAQKEENKPTLKSKGLKFTIK